MTDRQAKAECVCGYKSAGPEDFERHIRSCKEAGIARGGVAAPLEPTAIKLAHEIERTIPGRDDIISDALVERWAKMIGDHAAAVSKAKDDKIAELQARISELEKELRLDWKPYIL